MKNRLSLISAVLMVVFTTLIVACANMGSPDGGPYDETPPRVISTSPVYGAANAKSQKITLYFDENIKLENAAEKVIVSPPQIEQPEIDAAGKKITVTLLDSLKSGQTYTIDFSDAIEDNNEGNPMGDYAFTFSTGDHIDTMQVSGHVLDASNLEPIKGMMVGLYSLGNDSLGNEFSDTVFRTKPFERISRTDSRGHFIIKGIAPGNYRVYALQDQDQTFTYSQNSEMIGFNDLTVSPSSRLDVRPDTVWHDSIHYDSVVWKQYTHFFPDDITLLAFNRANDDKHLLKSERLTLKNFTLYFTGSQDSLPQIKGMNFDATDAFYIHSTEKKDTITYWIRDSLIYNLDTLQMSLTYYATDTLNQLVLQTDTLDLVSRQSKAKFDKQQKEEYDEWVENAREEYRNQHRDDRDENGKKIKLKDEEIPLPPFPEKFMDVKVSNTQIDPDRNIDFTFPEPIDTLFAEMFHFNEKIDSTTVERDFIIKRLEDNDMIYRFYAEWQPDANYELIIDTGAVVSIYGKRMAGSKKTIKVKGLDGYSTLFVALQGADPSAVVQLLNTSDAVVKTVKAANGSADFYFVNPGTYYLRMFYDRNGNGIWDSGNYDLHQQAEETYYYPGALNLKAQWDVKQTWNPSSTPIARQKPNAITKQKPEKEKEVKNRNAERERQKKGKNTKNSRNNNRY